MVTSHRALDGPVLSIEGARTYAHGISTGTAAVFRVLRRHNRSPRPGRAARGSRAPDACVRVRQLRELMGILSVTNSTIFRSTGTQDVTKSPTDHACSTVGKNMNSRYAPSRPLFGTTHCRVSMLLVFIETFVVSDNVSALEQYFS